MLPAALLFPSGNPCHICLIVAVFPYPYIHAFPYPYLIRNAGQRFQGIASALKRWWRMHARYLCDSHSHTHTQ
ncbi:hypothetical protein EON63_16480 [archaeon]|nr:MAG: hypothetical protein EON63_16480 [archaeon]